MFEIPSNSSRKAYKRSSLRLSVASDKVTAVVKSFVDDETNKYVDNQLVGTQPQAKLKLQFPTLAQEHTDCHFDLRFNNKTIEWITLAIYLYELEETPKGNSKLGKWILAENVVDKDKDGNPIYGNSPCHNDDGQPLFESLADFAKKYKLSGSVHKLYSILRENSIDFELNTIVDDITNRKLIVKTYFNTDINDYTISTVNFNSTVERKDDVVPRAKAYSVRRRNAGTPFA